jgi:V/A-type H+-transporting ATPase subunit I
MWNNKFGESLTCGLELLEREHDILTAPVKIAVSDHAFFIDGWIEMSRSEEVKKALSECCIFIDVTPFKIKAGEGGHGHSDHSHNQEMPPIAYQNRNFSKPMELLTDAVGRPAYGRIDPTLFMFVTYPIFFGMMLGDMAYGLITISLGAFIMGRAGTNDLMSLGGKFLVYIGLGTLAFGYLYAEFAGWEIFPHGHSNPAEALSILYPPVDSHGSVWHDSYPFGIELAYPFHRVTLVEDYGNLEHLVILTIYLGLIHILFGRLIGFRDVMFYGTDHGHIGVAAAFFEHGVWIILLIGGFLFSYGFLGPSEAGYMMIPGMLIAISAVIMLIWTLFNYHGIPFSISLILAPIEAIGMMPSVISYVRLFAVGVVGVKIAETGNVKLFEPMAHAIEHSEFLVVPFLLVGWLSVQFFAWGLGVFSPNIHAARLHFVEWMRQYYDSSGEKFTPFGFRSRHVEVE